MYQVPTDYYIIYQLQPGIARTWTPFTQKDHPSVDEIFTIKHWISIFFHISNNICPRQWTVPYIILLYQTSTGLILSKIKNSGMNSIRMIIYENITLDFSPYKQLQPKRQHSTYEHRIPEKRHVKMAVV